MTRTERDWFAGMAPKGYRIRMMEPGEARALMRIRAEASQTFEASGAAPEASESALYDFVRWLVAHDIFVAISKAGEPVGFAAARDGTEHYWLAGLFVVPGRRSEAVARALLEAAVTRAGWFSRRAVVVPQKLASNARSLELCGFVTVSRKDWHAILTDRPLRDLTLDGLDTTLLVRRI